MVVEVALYDRPEPLTRLLDWIVHALAELLFNFFQLGHHALGDRLALQGEVPVPALPADMLEAQEIERLWLTFSSLPPVWFGKTPELDPARLIWVELQSELLQPLREIFPEAVCVRLILKAQDEVSSAGDSHPRALSEPYVNLSAHTAPAAEPRRAPICQ